MVPDLDTGLLRNFLNCARHGSISRAALASGRTQPALSQQIRRLEDLIGKPLLDRVATGVTLTPAGVALLPYAERILALSGEALAGHRGRLSGRCSVGILEDFTGTTLPAVFADFGRMHPETVLELVPILSVETQAALDRGRIQLALCDAEYLKPPLRWSARLPLLWAAAEGFDATQNPLPLVLFSEPCRWRDLIQSALGAAGIGARVVFESGSLTVVQAAVRAGLGATVMLPTAMAPGLFNAAVSQVLPPVPMLEFGLARRPETQGDDLTDAVEELLKQLIRPGDERSFEALQ